MNIQRKTERRAPRALLAAGAALLVWGCGGDNLFTGTVTTTGEDRTPPTVQITQPAADSTPVAVGQQAFVQARVTDARRIASVKFEGFALTGNPDLGTQQRVDRFETVEVDLTAGGRVVRDTTLGRLLVPTSVATAQRGVLVVVTATDTAGNTDADTTVLNLGGPAVSITAPAAGTEFRAGSQLTVRLRASDAGDLISAVRLRTEGAFQRDTTITLQVPVAQVDTPVVLAIPAGASGALRLLATATSGSRLPGEAAPVQVTVTGQQPDVTAPRVTFNFATAARLEAADSLKVAVQAEDDTQVQTVGATIMVIRRTATTTDTVAALTAVRPGASDTIRFSLASLNLTGRDTMNLSLEATAFARDLAGNCGAAITPNVQQSLACVTARGATAAAAAGRLVSVLIARGTTVRLPNPTDRIADLASDGVRVFASNYSKNRVEVLPIAAQAFAPFIRVGSNPWGMAVGASGTELFVANSGSTTISRVPLGATLPAAESPDDRIETPNVVLFTVRFSVDDAGLVRLAIGRTDYSDRPQFIAQTEGGRLLYSTRPTAAATPGTLREYRPANPELGVRIFADYARQSVPGLFVVREAEDVFKYTYGSADAATDQLVVCDRLPGDAASTCFPGAIGDTMSFQTIQQRLTAAGFDAVLDFNLDPDLIPLTDTTFVAISGDRRTVAFGEGAVNPGRIIAYREEPGGNTVSVGNTLDLVNNASERVVGIALNPDGTMGAARGEEGYLFNRDLRAQGTIETGSPSGGVALHPNHNRTDPLLRLAFLSGEENGVPFVDVVDTFHSDSRRRIVLRERITGALIAVPRRAGDPAELVMRLYGVTASGIVAIDLYPADLAP